MSAGLEAQVEFLNIGVMDWYNLQRFSFQVEEGNYAVYADNDKICDLSEGEFLYFIRNGKLTQVKSATQRFGDFEKVYVMGKGSKNSFRITPIIPEKKIRYYDDNLKVTARDDELKLINNVFLENYIAGVVQAEVGPNPAPEFFKLQSILCRTYALDNLGKHEFEGYNLCDRVHCQAYYRSCSDPEIASASRSTRGLVIVDSDINLITAAFYSNCGGQTVNSEDVWQKPVYYLRSVDDPFCTSQPNARWEKKIPKTKWVNYMRQKNPSYQSSEAKSPLQPFYQPRRKSEYHFGSTSIPLKTIRSDFRLKSTFFDAVPEGEYIYLKGRGFGHGTGLCQEGAMKMASKGISYPEILHFYYRNVHLVDLSALDFFREEE
ncbi:MAG: SpoIID/LytB domain-containing protein [Vicingaceae bacterium]